MNRSSCPTFATRVNFEKTSLDNSHPNCNDSDISGYNSSLKQLNKYTGTSNVPSLHSNALSGPALAQCSDHSLSTCRKSLSKSLCSSAGKAGHVCVAQSGGIRDQSTISDDYNDGEGYNSSSNKSMAGDYSVKDATGTSMETVDISVNVRENAGIVSNFRFTNDPLLYIDFRTNI